MSFTISIRAALTGFLIALVLFIAAPPASATDPVIDAAISQGIVGERVDGYLGLVKGTAAASIQRKMNEINVKRRFVYEGLARDTGTTVEQVGIVTGEKQIARLPAGAYYMDRNGRWVLK